MSPMLEKVEEHYHKFFGPHRSSNVDLTEKYPVDLLIFPATPDRPFHTIATRGLSAKAQKTPEGMEDYKYQELLVYMPGSWTIDLEKLDMISTWPCMYLKFAARYSIDRNIFMGPGSVGHTEDSRPKVFEKFPYALYVPPLAENPKFYPITIDGKIINFSAIFLMTQAEADFMKTNGFRALLDAMIERERFDPIINPMRFCTFTDPSVEQEKADASFRMGALDMIERDEAVQEHYEKHFGKPAKVYEHEIAGQEGITGNRLMTLLIYPPTEARPFYTLATRGISDAEFKLPAVKSEYKRHELLMYLPPDWKPDFNRKMADLHWACKLLGNLVLHSFKGNSLAPVSTISIGEVSRPFVEGSLLNTAMIVWPLFETPEFNTLVVDKSPVRFCQVIPVTTDEAGQAANDAPALLRKMEAAGTLEQIADPRRPCTIDVMTRSMPRKPGYRIREPNLELPFKQRANPRQRAPGRPQRQSEALDDSDEEIREIARKARNRAVIVTTIVFVVAVKLLINKATHDNLPQGTVMTVVMICVVIWIAVPFIYAHTKVKAYREQIKSHRQ